MKINSLEFKNHYQEWEFEKLSFFKLTLLVGVSGVGKTQVLRSINTIKKIATGSSINGVEWDISFSTLDGTNYNWQGAFETLSSKSEFALEFLSEEKDEATSPKIIYEKLFIEKKLLIDRNQNEIIYDGNVTPKLASNESALSILKEEEKIKPITEAFKLIILRDHTEREGIRFGRYSVEKLKNKYKTLEEIKEGDIDTIYKLALVYENAPEVFKEIKESFVDVFHQIEDVKIEPIKDDDLPILFEAPVIQIKEKGVNKWIPHNRISSGMLRTLLHISEMFLWKEGTVILIDEFENSLGVNCIDILTEDLVFQDNQIQFIATSHHPYIINKIPYEYWKIVTRHGGVIKTFDAKEFKLGDSKHERFMSLINLPQYKNGIN